MIHVIDLPIFVRFDSLSLVQSYDWHSAIEGTLKDMGELGQYITTAKHNESRTMRI